MAKTTLEEPREVDLELAHRWCREMRGILGNRVSQKLGRGDAARLAKAESKVHDRLEKLHKLFPEGLPGAARELEKEYETLARHGQMLTEEHRELKRQLDELEKQRSQTQKSRSWKKKLSRDKSLVRDIDAEIESIKGLIDNKEDEIARQATNFESLAGDVLNRVDERVEQKEKYKQKLIEQKVSPDGVKAIIEAQKGYKSACKDAEKLVGYFEKNCDAEIARQAGNTVEAARVDIYSLYSPQEAQSKLTPMTTFVAEWGKNGKRGEYDAARKRFEKCYETARSLMKKAEGSVLGSTLTSLLDSYSKGNEAALSRNWIEADRWINQAFIETVNSALEAGAGGIEDWKQAETELNQIKAWLDELAEPAWNILALTPLGEAFRLAEQCDYARAAELFHKQKSKAKGVLEVAAQCGKYHQSLVDDRDAIDSLIAVLPHGPLSLLANKHQDALRTIPDEFWDNRHQATLAELKAEFEKCAKRLADIKQEIVSYTDPANEQENQKKIKEITDGRNVEACIKIVQGLIDATAPALNQYAAFTYDAQATSVAEPLATWQKQLEQAKAFVAGLNAKKPEERAADPATVAAEYKTHCSNLDPLAKAIAAAIQAESQAIEKLQKEIDKHLKWISAKLFGSRFDTFKQATWHKQAKQEHDELAALATTTSPAVLRDTLAKAQALRDRCQKVLKAMPLKELDRMLGTDIDSQTAVFQGTKCQLEYDELKSRLKRVRSGLKNKDLQQFVPKHRDTVAESLSATDAAIRAGGFIGLADAGELARRQQEVADVEKAYEALQKHFAAVKARREELENRLVLLRERITSELLETIRNKLMLPVKAEHLPVMKTANTLSTRLLTENLDEFKAIEVEIGMLQDDVTLLLLGADEPGAFRAERDAHIGGEADKRDRIGQMQQQQMEYEQHKRNFEAVWQALKKTSGLDKGEKDTIKSVKDQAIEAAKASPADWEKANKNMRLALKLAERLRDDPLASQTTDRGRGHLKELTPRWTRSIKRVQETVDGLDKAIEKSCQATAGVEPKAVGKVFEKVVASKFDDKHLVAGDFEAELLVLSRKAPLFGQDRQKDHLEKKKKREEALVKVRKYKRLLQKDLTCQELLFKANPWSTKGGAVDGLPLMRALNDLELNIERGIY